MNTVNNLFSKIIDKDNLHAAIHEAAMGKSRKTYVARALHQEDEVVEMLHEKLKNGSWKPTQIHAIKIINDGVSAKKREIVCPAFINDHVVHHAIMRVCKPYFVSRFYKHSYASVPIYGGLENMVKYIRYTMKDTKNTKYHVQLDIKQFYNSMKPSKVFHVLRRIIRDKKTLMLFAKILRGNKVHHPELGDIKRGCPIGLYTSQWFANILLTPLDNLIKSFGKKVVRYYVRYNDDMLLFSPNKRKLNKVVEVIKEHLSSIGLLLKHEPQIHRTSLNKISYVGATISYEKVVMKKKTFLKARRCLYHIRKKMSNKQKVTAYDAKRAFAYLARCRSFDMHNFTSSLALPLDDFSKLISYSDKRRWNDGRMGAVTLKHKA